MTESPRTAAGRALLETYAGEPEPQGPEGRWLRDRILEIEAEAAAAAPLDVERLAAALKAAGLWPQYPQENRAKRIAAEYTRLQASAPPLDPEQTP